MNDPYIVITALEEASVYGNVQQVKPQRLCCSSKLKLYSEILYFIFNGSLHCIDRLCAHMYLSRYLC